MKAVVRGQGEGESCTEGVGPFHFVTVSFGAGRVFLQVVSGVLHSALPQGDQQYIQHKAGLHPRLLGF